MSSTRRSNGVAQLRPLNVSTTVEMIIRLLVGIVQELPQRQAVFVHRDVYRNTISPLQYNSGNYLSLRIVTANKSLRKSTLAKRTMSPGCGRALVTPKLLEINK